MKLLSQYFNTSNVLDIKFQPGQRVAVYVNQNKPNGYYYGVIEEIRGSNAKVRLDRGNHIIQVIKVGSIPAKGEAEHIVPVEQWADNPKGQTYKQLTYASLPLSQQYLQKKSITNFGIQAMRAMYLYVSYRCFDSKLPKDIPFKFLVTRSNTFGIVYHKWNGIKYEIEGFAISKQQHLVYKIFGTVAHECIHVYQYYNKETRYPRSWDAHGPTFIVWIPFMKQHLHVDVTVKHEADEQEVLAPATDTPIDPKNSRYYVVIWENNGQPFGFKTLDQAAVGAAMLHGFNIYKSNDTRALVAMKTSRLLRNNRMVGNMLRPAVYDYWRQHGTIFWSKNQPSRPDFGYYMLIMKDKVDPNDTRTMAIYVRSSSLEKLRIVAEEHHSTDYTIYDVPKGFFGVEGIDVEDVTDNNTRYWKLISMAFWSNVRQLGKVKVKT